jgi:hypothetical protein
MRKSLVRNRGKTFRLQQGRCFYCELPMWLGEADAAAFAQRHGLSSSATLALRCTAEHMQARQAGGSHDPWNIVAACRRCNMGRHQGDNALDPLQYRQHVADALAQGVWHVAEIQNAFGGMAGTTVVGPAPVRSTS